MTHEANQPSWKKWVDFKGPTETEEREVHTHHAYLGRRFQRGRRDVFAGLRVTSTGGVWGRSQHGKGVQR